MVSRLRELCRSPRTIRFWEAWSVLAPFLIVWMSQLGSAGKPVSDPGYHQSVPFESLHVQFVEPSFFRIPANVPVCRSFRKGGSRGWVVLCGSVGPVVPLIGGTLGNSVLGAYRRKAASTSFSRYPFPVCSLRTAPISAVSLSRASCLPATIHSSPVLAAGLPRARSCFGLRMAMM